MIYVDMHQITQEIVSLDFQYMNYGQELQVMCGVVLFSVTAVVKRRQLHDHLISIRLECLCQMHHNTHQTDC
jgi:hypothetical protein